jgi:hypothetical protein
MNSPLKIRTCKWFSRKKAKRRGKLLLLRVMFRRLLDSNAHPPFAPSSSTTLLAMSRTMTPRSSSTRSKPLYYIIGGVVLFLLTGTLFGQKQGLIALPTSFSRSSFSSQPIEHPIPKLMHDAQIKYDALLARQSTTLESAVEEYKRRYGRKPPKGFDDWYKFAIENDVIIIDEYDQLIDDLRPFWLLSGPEIRRRSVQVGLLPSVDLVRVENGKSRTVDVNTGFDDAEVGARAKGFRVMIEKFQRLCLCSRLLSILRVGQKGDLMLIITYAYAGRQITRHGLSH